MKKVFTLIFCLLLLCSFSLFTFAEETQPVEESYTLLTRLWEYAEENSEKILGILGDVAVAALVIYGKVRSDKKSKKLSLQLADVNSDVSTTLRGQGAVVDVVNTMVESHNTLTAEYKIFKDVLERYGATEYERNRVVGALVAQTTAILEILTTVYANSKNLPQGVKDLVNLKYAKCLKSLENDEQLKNLIDAVRNNIGTEKGAVEAEV